MTRTECYLVLNSIRKVGPVRVRRLLEKFGSVESILGAPAAQLSSVDGIGRETARSIADWTNDWDVSEELQKAEELGIKVIDCEDAEYPPRLLEIYDPPLVLYYKGNLETLRRKGVGVVGTRHASHYGFETARKLSYQCAYTGLSIVSGLARGIDTAAHQGALAAGGRTVAVMGCSLDMMYPEENRTLAEKIAETDGTLVSEFCFGTPPDKYTFPMRNRVISGLSEGVLVVEAGKKSGAIITAKMALDQGRQVFAVPGRIDNPHASGCHHLIKDGARLVEKVEDVLSEFELLFSKKDFEEKRPLPSDLSEEEKVVLALLGNDETHLDAIIRKSGLPSAIVSTSLLRLELKRLARQLPGKYFIKTH